MPDVLSDPDRLAALTQRGLPDATPEPSFDRLTRWAQRGLGAAGAYVNFIDETTHTYKSVSGLVPPERTMPIAFSPCAGVVRAGETRVVEDASVDPGLAGSAIAEAGVRGYVAVPLRTHDGHALGTLCVIDLEPRAWAAEDVELLEELALVAMTEVELKHSRSLAATHLEQARRLAVTDPLTGLANRRAFDDRLAEEVHRASSGRERELGLVLLDLDGFKAVNDEHGHVVGDEVLVAITRHLTAHTRGGELLTRIGGDELALIVPGSDVAAAAVAAERLRGAMTTTATGVTLSAGVGAWHRGMTADDLTRSVDEALYAAKRHGGNRVVVADGGPGRLVARRPVPPPAEIEALASLARTPQLDLALDAVNELLGMDVSYATRMDDTEQVFLRLRGDGASFGVGDGTVIPREGTYCHHILAGRLPNAIGDVRADPLAGAMPVTEAAGVGAFASVPLTLSNGTEIGTLCCASHGRLEDLGPREVALLHLIARIATTDIERRESEADARSLEARTAGVSALAAAVAARDHYTGAHSHAVVALASKVAAALGLDARAIIEVEHVALLHDVGKLSIPDAILRHPGPLDEEQWKVMREHPVHSEAVIREVPGLEAVAVAVRSEHERWDGAGYPDGLSGTAIPLPARITLACDAYHAMISDRPYRPRLGMAAALDELERCAGSQFDPDVVAALLAVLR